MRKSLLLSLMVGSLPFLSVAKDGPSVPVGTKQLHFVENKGQVHDQYKNPRNDIQFSIPGKDMSLFVGDGQLHYQFYKVDKKGFRPSKTMADIGKKATPTKYSLYRMDVELVGANAQAPIVKEEPQEYVQRYYNITGNRGKSLKSEQQGIEAHSYNKITYKNVYPNIDWVIYTKNNVVEYDFVVRAGGNPSDIKLRYIGASSLRINEDGSLKATTPMGTITESAPYSFQEDGQKVNSSFKLEGDMLTFNIAAYTGTLVIDPTVAWGTYFGSTGDEEYNGISYGGGNVYAVGNTSSVSNMATVGADQITNAGLDDIFISSFSAAGVLQWSTYYGGPATDLGNGISYNANGNLYIAGSTDILGTNEVLFGIFTSTGAFLGDAIYGEDLAADDVGLAVRSAAAGSVYLCGYSNSTVEMATPGSLQDVNLGGYDGFIFKYDPVLDQIEWSTYYGGAGTDILDGIGIDGTGNPYAVGTTESTTDISTLNTYGGGLFDAFVTKLSPVGTWFWGRYYGGAGIDEGMSIDADATGNTYLTGYTESTGLGSGGFQNTPGGGNDAYLASLTTAGALSWSSYYGGAGSEVATSVHVNANGVYMGGSSTGTVTTTGGFQTTSGGGGLDAFMVRATAAGALTWGSYYGGNGEDEIKCITSDNTATFIGGITSSSNNIAVNTTVQTTISSGYDAFIARVNECTPPAQPGAITGSATVCAGSAQTYSVATVPGATSYTWTLPGGWTGTSTTNSISVTVGTTGGTISVTANNTCGASTAQTLAVTVNPIPTATITPAGPTTFCDGGSVILNANTGTGYTYQWYQGAPLPGQTNASYTATTSGSYTVEVTVGGCSATSSAVAVTVNPAPNATASSNSVVCAGQQLDLMGNSTTTGATYSWAGPGTFTSGLQNPSIPNAQAVNAGVYTLTVTANGCTQTATTTVVVASGAPAAPAAINGNISTCENSIGNAYDVTNDPNATQYNWTLPTGWSGTSTTNSISATAGAPGIVTIEVTAENGCGVSAPATLNVTVNPNPTPTITQSVNTLTVTGTYVSYQWYDGSGPIAGATGQSFNATGDGTYYCIVIDANGCTGTSNSITVTVGVNNIAKHSSVSLYPNPNNGSFTIEGAFASNDGKASVVIVDIAGRIVHHEQVTVKNGQLSMRIDMNAGLSSGVYTIKLSSDVANAVIPFVKK